MKKKKRILCLLAAVMCLASACLIQATESIAASTDAANIYSLSVCPEGPELAAEAGVLIDARTGAVLYGKNADEKLYPASITKLMTALLTLENCALDEVVTFSYGAINNMEPDASTAGILVGEELTVEQCLYALLIKSANEVANGLAEHIAGSVEAFADMMNERAKELGCTNTHFTNPHGLHDDDHYTTCYDMALIMRALKDNDTFISISSTELYVMEPTNKQSEPRYLTQMHKMLTDSEYTYDGAVAGKTGYTPEAGNTLVTYAVRGDTELIAVSMFSNFEHYDDTIAMLDYGFENFTAYDMSTVSGSSQAAKSYLSSSQLIWDESSAVIEVGSGSWVILPNDVSPSELESDFTLVSDSDNNVIATMEYTYEGVLMGNGTLLLADDEISSFDFEAHAETEPETAPPPDESETSDEEARSLIVLLIILAAVAVVVIILAVIFAIHRHRTRDMMMTPSKRVRHHRRRIRKARRRQGRSKF